MKVKIERTDSDVVLPKYQREGDAGMDLVAHNFKKHFHHIVVEGEGYGMAQAEDNIDQSIDKITLQPGSRLLIGTGLKVETPQGYEIQIRPRSGLALNQGITVANSPGTIDSNYRGEIGVILLNLGALPIEIKKGERIAQAVLKQVEVIEWEEADLSETIRGTDGFGSSGK